MIQCFLLKDEEELEKYFDALMDALGVVSI